MLSKLARADGGAYLCIAQNGVPSPVSKRIMVHVHCEYTACEGAVAILLLSVHPTIHATQNLVITRAGTEATLECKVGQRSCSRSTVALTASSDTQVEAAPRSVNYWMKVTGGAAKEPEAVNPGRRVTVADVDENAYTQRMVLRLAEVRPRDFGTYICIARNSLGEVRTTVQLQGEIYLYSAAFVANCFDIGIKG